MEDPAGRRDRVRWSLLVFAVALVLRGLALWQLSGTVLLETIIGDSRNYDQWAREVAGGDWIGSEVFYQAPLYPYFLALVYTVLGGEVGWVRCVQIGIGAASCALLTLAGWRFFSRPVGIVAGLLLAAYAPAIFADLAIQKSVLDVFFVCLLLWILGGVGARPRLPACLGLGLTLGALVLSRENALAFIAVLLPWLVLRPASTRERLAWSAAFGAGVALVLLPVAVRNWHVGDEFHLTTSQFGHNFFIGNNPAADGTYAPVVPRRGEPQVERQDAIDLAERVTGRSLTPAEVSAFYTRQALHYIRSQPGDWLALMGRKVAVAFTAVELVDTKDQYSHEDLSLVLRLSGAVLHFGVLAPLAVLGAWVAWPRRRRLLPVALLFSVYTATLLVFYMFARYRMPLVPMLTLFAAAGLVGLPGFWRSSGPGRAAACLGTTALAALLCNWPLFDANYMRSVTQYNLGNELAAAGRIDDAMERYRRALRLHGDNVVAHHNLGALHANRGELDAARDRYERALAIDPGYVQARLNLALVWNDLGEAAAARGERDRARDAFQRALSYDPAHARAQRNLERLAGREPRPRGNRDPGAGPTVPGQR